MVLIHDIAIAAADTVRSPPFQHLRLTSSVKNGRPTRSCGRSSLSQLYTLMS